MRRAHKATPTSAVDPTHAGAAGADHCAQDACAIQVKPLIKSSKHSWVHDHSSDQNKPIKHKGVTNKVTQGTASKLANNPTIETW
jgi:hypothetical protein